MPSSDEEAANPADKRAAETGEEPPAKKSRLRKEIHGLVKVVKDVVIGLTASTSTLDSTNESLQQAKKEIDALCIQLGVDQVSAKYFLASMQQHSTAMNNISWQVTGNKSQVNPTLKELCRDLNDKINTGNRRLDEIKQERRSQHEQSLQYLKGIESAVDRMVTALTQLNVVTAATDCTNPQLLWDRVWHQLEFLWGRVLQLLGFLWDLPQLVPMELLAR